MKKQRGVTITGLIIVLVVLVVVLLMGFKIVPAFLEYNTIQKHFRSMAEDPTLRSARRPEFDRAWSNRTIVDDVKSLSAESIEYNKEGDGWLITADYSVKVPLFRNVNVCIDFHPTSRQ